MDAIKRVEIVTSIVDDDCNIIFDEGTIQTCPHRPRMTFQDCEPGYGGHGDCPKWNYYHKAEVRQAGE